MKLFLKIIVAFLIFISQYSFGQNRKTDSLLNLIKNDKEDTVKAKHLNKLCREYILIGMYNDGLNYAEQSLALCLKQSPVTKGVKKIIAASYTNIGIIFINQSNYPLALKNHFAALKINEEINDKQGIAGSYNNLGNIYTNQSNFTEALKNYSASLNLKEQLMKEHPGDDGYKRSLAYAYSNIGVIYSYQGNYSEALRNYLNSLNIMKEIGDPEGISGSYTNLGVTYYLQNNYSEALKNYYASLKISEEIEDMDGIATSYLNLGTVYISLNKLNAAQDFLTKSLEISKAIGNKECIKTNYEGLTKIDSIQGNYRSEIKNFRLFTLYRDSIDNEETRKKTVQQSMTYDFEKKELARQADQDKKDLVIADEKQKQQIIIMSVSAGLFLVLCLAIVIFKSLRQNQKKNVIITEQKEIVEKQKEIVEEKHKEITDSINYAERIQRSFLATKNLLDENLKEYFVFFKPKDIVSGDFYWAGKLSNGHFALVTADSTGHGVPGAIMSILNISSIEKAVEQGLHDTSEILNQTRKTIIERLKKDGSPEGGKDGMDASLISFDFENIKLSYSAANNPIWIVRKNNIIELAPDKMPVGKHDKDAMSFIQHTIDLQKGDMVYGLTDGLPDQFGGPKGKKFMYKQLKEFLISISSDSMEIQKQKLNNVFNAWKGHLEQVDDITLIGIRI